MDIELKPCPFCGQADRLEIRRPMQPAATNVCNVWCHRCEFWGPSGQDAARFGMRAKDKMKLPRIDARQSAADAWNRRPEC